MILKERLLSEDDLIGCTACGKCCPRICPHKQENLCAIHPASQIEGEDNRDNVCRLSPTELVVFLKAACPPVGERIKALTNKELPEEAAPLGITIFNRAVLDSLLELEVGEPI